MAKSKALVTAEARIAGLEALLAQRDERIAALESKVSLARTLYLKLRDDITPVVRSTPQPRSCAHAVTPVVTQFYDTQGQLWIKTRIGNRATSRLANASSGAEHDAHAPNHTGGMPVVTRFQDALGRTWIKTRIDNKATSRLADAPAAPEYDEGGDHSDFGPHNDDTPFDDCEPAYSGHTHGDVGEY